MFVFRGSQFRLLLHPQCFSLVFDFVFYLAAAPGFTMALRLQQLARFTPQQRLTTIVPHRGLRTTPARYTGNIGPFTRPVFPPKGAILQDRRIIWVVVGTVTAGTGLFYANRNSKRYSDDPRDVKALSSVPFRKLCSGWM